jgi:hypothetical protein
MQAQVIRASLHQRRAERPAQRFAQHRDVFEEDLFLKILRTGGHEDALAAEDCGDQVGQRFARARARFGDQRAPMFDNVGNRGRHRALPFTRLVAVNTPRQRTRVFKH